MSDRHFPTSSGTTSPLLDEEREVALAKYVADRAHELELDRAAGGYEHAYYKGLFALNGGSAAAFVALQGKDLPVMVTASGQAWCALACWLGGLLVAYVAGWIAYEAQKTFAAALRARRHALALRLFGRHDPEVIGISPNDTPGSLVETGRMRQAKGDRGWTIAHVVGLVSAALFVAGAVLAALAVASTQAG